jgi:hypothetical protein
MTQVRNGRNSERRDIDLELHGHANIRADICFSCKGKLKAPDGSYCESFYDDGLIAFSAAICRSCKDNELVGLHGPGNKSKPSEA